MTPPDPPAEVIFHLTTPAEWAEAQRVGQVVPAGFAAEGFVHCSTPAQLYGTIAAHFQGVDELVLLQMDPAALGGDLRWEPSRDGQLFPHLYRPVALSDVVAVREWRSTTADQPPSDADPTGSNPA